MLEQSGMGGAPPLNFQSSSAAESANRNEVNNSFSTGDFNAGTGAGSSGLFGVIGLVIVVMVYLFVANKK